MAKPSKRLKAIREKVEPGRHYTLEEAIELIKETSTAGFDESVDVAVRLGIDPRKSDQVVRGSTQLPHGTGKNVRVAVFAQGEKAEQAEAAGADVVGFDDLAERVQQGEMDFDVVIATPDAMKVVGKLGKVLGPRGLMPNPKVGTVTNDVEAAVQGAKAGQVRYRADKSGIVHGSIGKADFDGDALKGNLRALLSDLIKAKPPSAKGQYLRKVALSTTMGPGITLAKDSLAI